MNTQISKSEHIAILNTLFRHKVLGDGQAAIPGGLVITAGIAALGDDAKADIFLKIREFDHWDEGNDPYGEKDFGALDQSEVGKVFWKIDYYADSSLQYGSEAPEDTKCTYRILTIMLASEY